MTSEVFSLIFVIVVTLIIVGCGLYDFIYMKKKIKHLEHLVETQDKDTKGNVITVFLDRYDLIIAFKNGDKVTYDKILPLTMKDIYEDLLSSDNLYLQFQHDSKDVNINRNDIRSYSIVQSYLSENMVPNPYSVYDYKNSPFNNTNLWNSYTYTRKSWEEPKSKKISWNDRYKKLLEEDKE